MKVLFLGSQNIFGQIHSGGAQCSKRNYDLIYSLIGSENFYTGIVFPGNSNHSHIRYFERATTNIESLISSFCLCRLYKPKEEKKILSFIEFVDPDVLFLDTPLFGKILKKINPRIKTILFTQNVEIEYAKHRLKSQGLKLLPAYVATRYNEYIAIKYADRLTVLNKRDSDLIKKIYNRCSDYLLPISFQDVFNPEQVKRKKAKKIIFIGSNFPPNYDGIEWFIDNVMVELSDFQLLVIGKDFEKEASKLERNNVSIVGTVQSLEEYYYHYSMVVMPIRYGDGMKVKTAEAMMYGMTIFATDEALEGYDVNGVSGIYRCNTAQEFISSIKNHYSNTDEVKYNKSVREVFKKNYDADNQVEIMKKILSE